MPILIEFHLALVIYPWCNTRLGLLSCLAECRWSGWFDFVNWCWSVTASTNIWLWSTSLTSMGQRRSILTIFFSIGFFSLVSSIYINPIDLGKVFFVSLNCKFSSFSLLGELSYMSPIVIENISTNLELRCIKYKVRLSLWILNTADLSFTSSISFPGLVSINKEIKVVRKQLHLVIVIADQ